MLIYPSRIATEFRSQKRRDARRGFQARAGIKEQRPGSPRQHILHGSRRLKAGGPDDLDFERSETWMECSAPFGTLSEQRPHQIGIRAVMGKLVGMRVIDPAMKVQIGSDARSRGQPGGPRREVDRRFGHRAIRRPFATRDRHQSRLRDDDGMFA